MSGQVMKYTMSGFIKINPGLKADAITLGLLDTPHPKCSFEEAEAFIKRCFPSMILKAAQESNIPGSIYSGTTEFEMIDGLLRPIVSIYFKNPLKHSSHGQYLYEIGHACCMSQRPDMDLPSLGEYGAYMMLESINRGEEHMGDAESIAAWVAALLLAAILEIPVRSVLVDILFRSSCPPHFGIRVFYHALGSRSPELFLDEKKLFYYAGLKNREQFFNMPECERMPFINHAVSSLILEIY